MILPFRERFDFHETAKFPENENFKFTVPIFGKMLIFGLILNLLLYFMYARSLIRKARVLGPRL